MTNPERATWKLPSGRRSDLISVLMKRAWVFFLLAGLLCVPVFAQKRVDEIVARVNAEIILKSELADSREQILKELKDQERQGGLTAAQVEQAMTERERHLLRDMIDNSLLLQVSKEMGLSADLEVVRTMERMRVEFKFGTIEDLEKAIVEQGGSVEDFKQNIRTRYLTQQVISREVYPKIIITTEEIRSYYEEHKSEFDRPAGVRLREIAAYTEGKTPEEVAAAKKKIEDALEAVKKGEDFGETAQKFSESQTAENGGDMGFFAKGEFRPEFEQAAAKLQKGQTSDVLELPFGYVILKLEDRHDGGILPFELAQSDLQNRIWQSKVQPKIREYLTKLRTDGFVEVREGYTDSGAAPPREKPVEKDNKKTK